ncbi:MAG: GNAT family N-acetyltransferase [Oligosphaeraceae bacterium]|nr:GNAT family N-acetyltransferase [Oligosphaeraceae bacterium]
MNSDSIKISAAVPTDAYEIPKLLAPYVERQIVLPRTPEDILQHLGNFLVARRDDELVGVVALRDFGAGLQEIRSLAVSVNFSGRGLGSKLLLAAIDLAKKRNASRVFALTLRPRLFQRLGFVVVEKEEFPQKVWADCSKCPKLECCDEIAVSLLLSNT